MRLLWLLDTPASVFREPLDGITPNHALARLAGWIPSTPVEALEGLGRIRGADCSVPSGASSVREAALKSHHSNGQSRHLSGVGEGGLELRSEAV